MLIPFIFFFSFGLIRTIFVPKCPLLDEYQFFYLQGCVRDPRTAWSATDLSHKPADRTQKLILILKKHFLPLSCLLFFFQLPIFLLRFIPLLVIVTTFEL